MKANNLRMALALTAIGALALIPAVGIGGNDEFDPLLDGEAFCGPPAERPPLLQKLILAQTETKPFKPQPMQAAGGEIPLYDNLGSLSFKVGTRNATAQAYFDQGMMGIPGEELPKVAHYYGEPHPYFDADVVVIGGKNSAAIAALELWRHAGTFSFVRMCVAVIRLTS